MSAVGNHLARVRAMSPRATLERGYAVLVNADGRAVTSVQNVSVGDELTARLLDGEAVASVTAIMPGKSQTLGSEVSA